MSDAPDPDRIDYDKVADEVLARLDPASVVGDRVVLSRRQALALGTGATSLAALGLFSGTAEADVVGQVGTQQDRVDVFAGAVDANSVSTSEASVAGVPNPTFASGFDDLSDIAVSIQSQSPTSATNYVALDVTDGSKVAWISGAGSALQEKDGNGFNSIGPITVDGTSNSSYPSASGYNADNDAGNQISLLPPFPILYDTSLKVEWRHRGSGNRAYVQVARKGSGPHTAVVVKDGEPAYQIHESVGRFRDGTVDFDRYMSDTYNIPNGYSVVKDPDLSEVDPFSDIWDADKQSFVPQ